MGSLWRSEDMTLVALHMQREAAHETVKVLGELGLAQFKDLNAGVSAFQRLFANDVKRCDELERKLRFFTEQINELKIRIPPKSKPATESLERLEAMFDNFERELREVNSNAELLNTDKNRLIELDYVLRQDGRFFDFNQEPQDDEVESGSSLLEDGGMSSSSSSGRLGFVTGVIVREKMVAFERVLFRATRGNLLLRQAAIDQKIRDPVTGEEVNKNVFIVFFSGDRSKAKITKICESFGANMYPYPENHSDVRAMMDQVNSRLRELDSVIGYTTQQKDSTLKRIAVNIECWGDLIQQEKAIYHTLNMFDFKTARQSVQCHCWVPTTELENVRNAIRKAQKNAGAQVGSILEVLPTRETPPTYFRTNKYTQGFQSIVDSYGIPTYKEVNPGVFTIITFPFLFAVMFGDAGHGIMMFIFALWMCLNEKKLAKGDNGEIFKMIFGGRYVLLLMGAFSIYTGLLYNDWFSLSINIFGTGYYFPDPVTGVEGVYVGQAVRTSTVAFGLDPIWYGSPLKLSYINSFKMKLSVILGVTQMVAGIIMSLFNHLYHKDSLDIWVEFIPEMIFMLFTFGYMVVMIFIKWSINYDLPDAGAAPNLLLTMTDFFLGLGGVSKGNQLYNGQAGLQSFLIAAALLSVPVLLLPKPFILRNRHRKAMALRGGHSVNDVQLEVDGHTSHGHGDEEVFEFGEAMVKQMIHTIEFVLGAVSNTASYLRLWALSLAHAQLSEVLWEQIMMSVVDSMGSSSLGFIGFYIAFAIWLGATIGILLLMESLSAFLHALRLHWVEFNNKFYAGQGYKFIPFNFATLATATSSDE